MTHDGEMAEIPCPHGCGGVVVTGPASAEILVDDAGARYRVEGEGINVCPSCRRHISEVQIPEPGMCWAWFGPSDHRMRCRRPVGHGTESRPGIGESLASSTAEIEVVMSCECDAVHVHIVDLEPLEGES